MSKKFTRFICTLVMIFVCFQSVSAMQNEAVTVPTPVSPRGTITSINPSFSWSRVAGATQYQFQVLKSTKSVYIGTLLASDCGEASNCVNTPATVLGAGSYTWKVRAFTGGAWKSYSSPRAFSFATVPTPISPTGTISGSTPSYSFSKINGATQYQVQLYKGIKSVYDIPILASTCGETANCINTPGTVLVNGAYTWKVRAYVGGAWKNFSAFKSFTLATPTPTPTPTPVFVNKIMIDFSPYIDGQDPNKGINLTEAQIRQRLQIIAPYSSWVRSFSCGNGLEVIGRLAHEMGLKVAVNAWIGTSETVNQQQIACLIKQAKDGYVDLAIVGSEAVLRRDVTVSKLTGYIDQARLGIPLSIPVTTADVYSTFLDNPALVDHLDLIFANIYPFWEGYNIQYGTSMVNYYYNQLVSQYPTKTIKISETGWPSCGSFNDAVGSVANEAAFFNQIETWARDKNVPMFYFSGLDEAWKTAYEGAQGACWGIWNKSGVLKAGMSPVFSGTDVPYSLDLPLTCNTNTVSINFTYVPPVGSYKNVEGKSCGIFYKDYKVVLFIKVGGSWWVKPTLASPKTAITVNGTWTIDYTTGGSDQLATELKAYLIPNNVDPFGDLSGYPVVNVTR